MAKRNRKRRRDPNARAAAREARRAERRRLAARARWRRRTRRTAVWSGGAALVLVVGYLLFRPGSELDGVVREPERGRDHVSGSIAYGTPAPTSGPHAPHAPACGWYDEPLAPELAVHALEHGAVVAWYREDGGAGLATALRRLVDKFDHHLIVSPNSGIQAPIVATAWTRLKRYENPQGVEDFVETYRERGPERLPCDQSS